MQLKNILNQGLFARGKICDDCLSWIVNNDDSGASEGWDKNTCQHSIEKFDILNSEIHDGDFGHDCFHKGKPCEDDCECTKTLFTPEPCQACNTPLAGSRTDVLFIRRTLYGKKK